VRERIGDYDPNTRLAEDYDYWIRISKQFLWLTSRSLCTWPIPREVPVCDTVFEVKVVDFLLRLKHGMLDTPQVAGLYRNCSPGRRRGFARARRGRGFLLGGAL